MKVLKCEPCLGLSFPLTTFLKKLENIKTAEGKRHILVLTKFRVRLWTIIIDYNYVSEILRRIDNDLYNDLEYMKKLRLVDSGIRVKADELPPANLYLTNIDIMSLIIFLNFMMDDIARFLHFLFKGNCVPETKSFAFLKKSVSKFEGNKLEKLIEIIRNTAWYDELIILRDKPIVHHRHLPGPGIGVTGNEIGIHLHHIQDNKIVEKFLSNLEINQLSSNVSRFLVDLNAYLCNNFNCLPLEVSKKCSNKYD